MRDALTTGHFGAGVSDVPDDLDLLDEGLVLIHIEDDCSTLAVLRQDQGPLGFSHLLKEACGIRSEGGKWLNVLTRL